MIWSKFIWIIFSNEWIRLFELWRNHQPINDQIIKTWTSSCQRPKLKLLENPREINSFLPLLTRNIFELIYTLACNFRCEIFQYWYTGRKSWTVRSSISKRIFRWNCPIRLILMTKASCWFVNSDCSLLLTNWFFE